MSAPPTHHRRVSSWFAVGAFAIAALILASAFSSASGRDGRVHGFVTDSVSGGPIAGATVRIEAADLPWVFETTTDPTGYYEVAVPGHRYSVTAWSVDHDQATSTVAAGSGQTAWRNGTLPARGAPAPRPHGLCTEPGPTEPRTVG